MIQARLTIFLVAALISALGVSGALSGLVKLKSTEIKALENRLIVSQSLYVNCTRRVVTIEEDRHRDEALEAVPDSGLRDHVKPGWMHAE